MGTTDKPYYLLPTINLTHLWPELNKLLENPPPLKLPRKPLPERQPEKPPPQEVESKDHTDSDQEPLHLERSEDIKKPLTSSLENFHSKGSSEKSLTNSTLSSDSNPPPSSPSKKLLKLISSDFSKTPIFALSMPKELPSWPEMSNSPEELEAKDSDFCIFYNMSTYKLINVKYSKITHFLI